MEKAITVSSESLDVNIDLNGVTISCIKFKDKDILFPFGKYLVGDIYKNRGGIPFLFPNAGKAVEDKLKNLNLKQHGFARDMVWDLSETNSSMVVLSLKDTLETFEMYPYHFDIKMKIEVSENTFSQTLLVKNNSQNEMPVALGFHPYFYVPIEEKDNFVFKIVDFDNTIYLEKPKETIFTLKNIANIKMETSENLKTLAIWSEPNRPHICIEPWVGNEYVITDDSNCVNIKPGQSEQFMLKLVITPVN